MNLVLFEPQEVGTRLPRTDRRVQHLLNVLQRKVGDTFDAGVVNGPRGKAALVAVDPDAVAFAFVATSGPPKVPSITLIVGLPRPQTARDILRDASTLGLAAIHFVRTDKGEPGYAQSTLWSSGEWRRHVMLGAEQAFDTQVPAVTHGHPLEDVLATSPGEKVVRIALDNYEASVPLSQAAVEPRSHVLLAIGSERGWSPAERDTLRLRGFTFAHLGPRVLRTETAVVAALTLVRAKLGLMG